MMMGERIEYLIMDRRDVIHCWFPLPMWTKEGRYSALRKSTNGIFQNRLATKYFVALLIIYNSNEVDSLRSMHA